MKYALFLVLLALPFQAPAFSNGGFEAGSLAGWTVTYGGGNYALNPSASVVLPGGAPDTYGNLNTVYSGNYACQLISGMSYTNPDYHQTYATISQTDVISGTNTILQFYYAAVLDGAHSAVPSEDAFVVVDVYDNTKSKSIVSKTYAYASSPAPLVDDGAFGKKHLPWTAINLNLAAYVGDSVTIRVSARDCYYGGHYSLAYVDGFDFIPPSATFTKSPTRTVTPTRTPTRTASPTRTMTLTRSPTPSRTPTFTNSPTRTMTSTRSPTHTQSPTFSNSPTRSLTRTPSPSFTASPTKTPSPTLTASLSFTETSTFSTTPSHTITKTVTPTFTETATFSATRTITRTHTITPTFSITRTFSVTLTPVPQSTLIKVHGFYPNPFDDHGTVYFTLKGPAELSFTAYNVAGEIIWRWRQSGRAGINQVTWNGENDQGARVASGIYLLSLVAESPDYSRDTTWVTVCVSR